MIALRCVVWVDCGAPRLGGALLGFAGCMTSSNIRPSELERLDGYQAYQPSPAERPLATVEGQSIAFNKYSKLFLDLPEQRVGGSFRSIEVREGVFDGWTADGRQVQTPVAQIRGASVEELNKGRTAGVAIGILIGLVTVVGVSLLVLANSLNEGSSPGHALRIRKRIVKAPLTRADRGRPGAPATTSNVVSLSPTRARPRRRLDGRGARRARVGAGVFAAVADADGDGRAVGLVEAAHRAASTRSSTRGWRSGWRRSTRARTSRLARSTS